MLSDSGAPKPNTNSPFGADASRRRTVSKCSGSGANCRLPSPSQFNRRPKLPPAPGLGPTPPM